MMEYYANFEDAIYTVLDTLYPEVQVLFAHDNGPEQVTPYITIQVIDLDDIGREELETLVSDGSRQIAKTFESRVIIKVVGDEDKQVLAGNIASDFQFMLETPKGQDILGLNNLSLMRKGRINRIPAKQDTAFYMVYSLDLYFAFTVIEQQDSDWIDKADIEGHFFEPY